VVPSVIVHEPVAGVAQVLSPRRKVVASAVPVAFKSAEIVPVPVIGEGFTEASTKVVPVLSAVIETEPPPPEEEILMVLLVVPSKVIPAPATKLIVGLGEIEVCPETVPPSALVSMLGLPAPPEPEKALAMFFMCCIAI